MQSHHRLPLLLASALTTWACGTGGDVPVSAANPTPTPNVIPIAWARPPASLGAARPEAIAPALGNAGRPTLRTTPSGGHAPNLGNRLFSNGGAFSFPNGTSPGTAAANQAPVLDETSGTFPSSFGTGSYDVTVNGNQYQSTTPEAIAQEVVDDSTGALYLLVALFSSVVDPVTAVETGTVLYVIVPSADFAVGATVQFDGTDRLALFATGDTSQPDPSVAAAAVTGSVTFTGGGLNIGDLITLNLSGDFGEISWQSQPPPPPPVSVGNIAAGTYLLDYDPTTYVQCDGTLTGLESYFTGIHPAAFGFSSGTVTVTAPQADQLDLAGPSIAGAFGGAASLLMEAGVDAPPGTYVGFAELNGFGSGPAATDQVGAYLLLDDASAGPTFVQGQAGALFVTPDQQGFCSVDFGASLVP